MVFLLQVGLDFAEEGSRVLGDFNQNVPTVTVSVNEVVLHQHLEEGHRT